MITSHPVEDYGRKVAVAVGITALTAGVLLIAWLSVEVLLMAFSGVLLATLLRAPTDWLSRHTRLSEGWALLAVGVGLIAVLTVAGWLWAPSLGEQFDAFQKRLPEAIANVERSLSRSKLGRLLLVGLGGDEAGLAVPERLRRLSVAAPLRAVVSLVTILFVGIFLAANPRLYVRGLVVLMPRGFRPRFRALLSRLGYTLRWFLLGRLVAMAFVGALTVMVLRLFGIPQALFLGILAGLLTFVPYLGPILGGVPIGVVALVQAPGELVGAMLAYTVVQLFEGYILSPLIQQRTVDLPPALTLGAQVLMGILLGGLGVALAAPLAAVLLVVVQLLYVEDVLGDRPSTPTGAGGG